MMTLHLDAKKKKKLRRVLQTKLTAQNKLEGTIIHLIAGYVTQVAILFEIAPKRKAIAAERDAEDPPFSALFCLFFSARCLS